MHSALRARVQILKFLKEQMRSLQRGSSVVLAMQEVRGLPSDWNEGSVERYATQTEPNWTSSYPSWDVCPVITTSEPPSTHPKPESHPAWPSSRVLALVLQHEAAWGHEDLVPNQYCLGHYLEVHV